MKENTYDFGKENFLLPALKQFLNDINVDNAETKNFFKWFYLCEDYFFLNQFIIKNTKLFKNIETKEQYTYFEINLKVLKTEKESINELFKNAIKASNNFNERSA